MNERPASVEKTIKRWPTEKAREWVLSFLSEVERRKGVLAVIAVGSAVRPSVESEDLDLLLVRKEGSKGYIRPPIEIDLREYEVSHIDKELASGADMLSWAVKYGIPLFDRSGTWEGIVQRWRGRLKLPDPRMAEDRAAIALEQYKALETMGDASAANEARVSYLTHRSRAALSRARVFPASRPELVSQLRSIGEEDLASQLEYALDRRKELSSESVSA